MANSINPMSKEACRKKIVVESVREMKNTAGQAIFVS